ncbi:transposase [bacterium]|nr:transposase [bacterium]
MHRNRKLNRLPGYDYSSTGMYYVTICVYDNSSWFGDIKNGTIHLNDFGRIIQNQWFWLANHFYYVSLDAYVIMPDHIHGILEIVGNGRDHSLQTKIKPLPELIGAFKTTSAKSIHNQGGFEFKWQKSFHDHVIRTENALLEIRKYIQNNPIAHDNKFHNTL